ncbi:uncharacterized protein LOC143603529 [Bidens hawaiensis]|uniref:uncharacterized protein LOC143603529 n=1 Tax=Bidens hawaiensis TaxID=980011 RepID=UPI00404AFA1E
MDRRSWLWRRKSSEKSTGETESSGGSVSSHSERFSDDQVYSNQNSQSLEVVSTISQRTSEHNHVVKSLSDKLSEALGSINAKEQLVNQHAKVAEEAVSGWEKAEREVVALRQQVEVLTARNSTLKDRVVHLDEALKECMRQLRQTREEKEQIANEALEKKVSGSESSLTSIETNLHQKLEMIEKENLDLKHKISSMAEELEIRIIERDLSNQAAEQASKQRLDSVKKVARLEAECRRLNSALKKANNNPIKAHKKPSVTERGDFKEMGRLVRNRVDSVIEIDLMDDFLEMERLVAFPGTFEVEDRGNELKESRNRLEEAESKLADRENELKASRNQVKEAESKLADCENELKTTRNRLKEAESKLTELENEIKISRNSLEEAEFKLSKCKNELKATRNRLEEAESKLYDRENELKESESKLAECENELNESTTRLEEAESKLAERENELKLSRYQLEKAESKLAELEIELNASTYLLEEAEFKLHNTTNRLEMCEAGLEAAHVKKEEAESRCKALEAEIEMLLSKVDYLENNIQKERDLSRQTEGKYQDLKDEVSKLQHEVQETKSRNRAEEFRYLKIKQDKELAIAGSQFVECQKTIASLNQQLLALATLDDFLIDTNSL